MPGLGAQLREEWNLVPPADRSVAAWAALNAFAARLTPDILDLTALGLWTIGSALETVDGAPAQVPAAVRWFVHAGAQLASATRHGRPYVGGKPGEPAGFDSPGFSAARWSFWRSRLAALAAQGNAEAAVGLRALGRHDAA